jgi:hypothetical protein
MRRLAIALLLVAGCDDPPKKNAASTATATPGSPGTAASPSPSSAPPGPASASSPSTPDLLVDGTGPFLAGTRIDLGQSGAQEKLTTVIKSLPIDGKQVVLSVEKTAKIPHVSTVVAALGAAGAPKIVVKTAGRNDLPKELTLTPESRVSSPPGCSVVTMVTKDRSTAVWPMKGGTGKRHRKGFAGPDLSHTAETLKKELEQCSSTVAFFSSDESVPWELAYNLAGTLVVSDEKKKIDTIVLLREAPVAGRPVTLGK